MRQRTYLWTTEERPASLGVLEEEGGSGHSDNRLSNKFKLGYLPLEQAMHCLANASKVRYRDLTVDETYLVGKTDQLTVAA
jgi:hypothetical protein